MRKKFKIAQFSIIFAILIMLLTSFSFVVFADNGWQEDLPLARWNYITRVSGGVMENADSSGRHVVGGDVFLRSLDNKVELNATVQSFRGAWYNTSYKWTNTGYGVATVAEPIYLAPGTYRMRLIVKVYSPSDVLLEETTLYTGETII